MGSYAIGKVVLMSIQPFYANAILQGTKRVEFRKRPMAHDVSHVLLYATKPVGAIIGAFVIAGQYTTTPERLWDTFHTVGGIGSDPFHEYYGELNVGTGIKVGEVLVAPRAFPLQESLGISRAPQSFQFVDSIKAKTLIDMMDSSSESDCATNTWPFQLSLNAHAD